MPDGAILIDVSFNSFMRDIGEKPSTLSGQKGNKRLNARADDAYQPLAGRRGVFRLSHARHDALKAAALNGAGRAR